MLKNKCINPLLMQELAFCGHGDKILLVDANYPLKARSGDAPKIYLALTPGVPTVPQAFETICSAINIEKIEAMLPDDGSCPEALSEVLKLSDGMSYSPLSRWDFYEQACSDVVRVAVSTGEKRTYACLLLTVGVV